MSCVCCNAEVGSTMMNVTSKSSSQTAPSSSFSLRHIFFFSLFFDWNKKGLGGLVPKDYRVGVSTVQVAAAS